MENNFSMRKAILSLAEVDAKAGYINSQEYETRKSAIETVYKEYKHLSPSKLREVMTTANFNDYFADALQRRLLEQYQFQRSAWQDYTKVELVNDTRDKKLFSRTPFGTLYRRGEKGEATADGMEVEYIEMGVEEFTRQFDVSIEAILNDDLGAIMETPRLMFEAARRFEDSFVSNLFDNATSQAALVGLGANYAGTGRLTHANLMIGIAAMASRLYTRSDGTTYPIAVEGLTLVIPPILAPQAETIFSSQLAPGVATNDVNVVNKYIRGYRVDPYIGFTAPNIPWYLFASNIPAVSVVRLQAAPAPFVVKKRSDIESSIGQVPAFYGMGSFNTGDAEWKVVDYIGGWDDETYAGITDYQGVYYSSGTTA